MDTDGLAYLRVRPAKTETITPAAQLGVLNAYLHLGKRSWWERLKGESDKKISVEIISLNQKTYFYMVVPKSLSAYFSSQLSSHYPRAMIEQTTDPLLGFQRLPTVSTGLIKQASDYGLPIKTFKDQAEGTLLSAPLGILAKTAPGEALAVQMIIRIPPQGSYIRHCRSSMQSKNSEGVWERSSNAGLYEKKVAYPLFEVQASLIAGATDTRPIQAKVDELAGSLGVYTLAESNSLTYKIFPTKNGQVHLSAMLKRSWVKKYSKLILNTEEIASLWHLPDETMTYMKTIDWGKTMLSEAPENLPVAEDITDPTEKQKVNFFGRTEWRNHEAIFGIHGEDRRKHIYIIGKTGSGKSTLIANMAINDIRNGKGVAVVDPHGDLCEMILNYIPKRRVNDVIYLDPTLSDDRSFALNLFDDDSEAHTDVVASGIISVFYKLYHHSWGPRLEYILRNAILTLLYYKKATFADLIALLTQANFRNRVVDDLSAKDPVLTAFWREEFDKMNDKLRMEAISPILNKVGQFLSSQRIRHIVGSQHSTFSFDEVMNRGKILLLNLAQGKLGEDTTALLGAMFITKMQLTAMQRVEIPEYDRRDFYLYVDEFQNFATQSFVKILSEARKYHLNLIMANQYIGQVDEEIQMAIFGNVGSLITFVVGARDAMLLTKEFGIKYTPEELVALGKFEILLKMSINGLTSEPFYAATLPLPSVINDNKDTIMKVSLERYYRKV